MNFISSVFAAMQTSAYNQRPKKVEKKEKKEEPKIKEVSQSSSSSSSRDSLNKEHIVDIEV